jgi:hypothetical protein
MISLSEVCPRQMSGKRKKTSERILWVFMGSYFNDICIREEIPTLKYDK